MEADEYVAEHIIRDRLAEARARAGFAALHRQANEDPPGANGIGRRLGRKPSKSWAFFLGWLGAITPAASRGSR